MKKFFVATSLFASIAYVATHLLSGPDNPFNLNLDSPLSASQWALDLTCTFDQRTDGLQCNWHSWTKEEPIPTQPVRKDFRFELSHEETDQKLEVWKPGYTNKFVVIESDPKFLPAEVDKLSREIGNTIISFPMKVSCVRNNGFSTVLWCEKWVYDTKSHAHQLSLHEEL